MKVVFATPTIIKPWTQYIEALERSLPLIDAAGYEHAAIYEVGNPYINGARAAMLRKALDAQADIIIFIDHDVSWDEKDLLTLIQTSGDVVAGTYRFKKDEVEYMGGWMTDANGIPLLRHDGCLRASAVPAGFLKVTKEAVDKFMRAYPQLIYGPMYHASVDLFNYGAIDGVFYGEDFAFCKRWLERCGEIALIPNLNITHHSSDKSFPGNLHEWLLRQPGGSKAV